MAAVSPGTVPAGASQQQISVVGQNMLLRSAFTANSLFVKKTLPSVPLVAGVSNYAIPLNNQGALVGLDLECSFLLTNGATANVANPGSPYSLLSNINFVDQSNVTRHNLSGLAMWDYLNFNRGGAGGVPAYNGALSLAEGGGNVGNIAYPVCGNMAANGTQTVKFLLHVPIAKSKYNTTGMVLLQTGNQNQPAVLNVTLTPYTGGAGNGPFTEPFTFTSGTITVHQLYWQPQGGAVAPPLDTQVQWALTETAQDNTNLIAGAIKEVQFQTQYKTSAVGIRYYNGSAFTFGTDMTSVIEKTLGGTFYLDDDDPNLRFMRYRNARGFDCSPGLYWFDYRNNPLQYQAVGIYQADFVPATVNAGAYMTYLYDWLKVPSQLAALPGASQLG